jgi:hypothetical protein
MTPAVLGLIALDAVLFTIFGWTGHVLYLAWKAAGREVDEAIAMVCQPCNGYSRTARCTCSSKCPAAVCMAPAVRRG